MTIESLKIDNFRNLKSLDLHFSPEINLIIGNNASGKTSLLEAIHFLSCGKSFRTHKIEKLIQYDENAFSLFSKIKKEDKTVPLGLKREKKTLTGKLDGKVIQSLSVLANLIPLQIVSPDSHKLIEEGPIEKRKFLDWGVFHVEHSYLSAWQNYQKSLKQRNAAIKNHDSVSLISSWDQQLAQYGELMNQFRSDYIVALNAVLPRFTQILFQDKQVELVYKPGWDTEKQTLLEKLEEQHQSDINIGYTQSGPHRADIKIKFDGYNAQEHVSRGQQKTLALLLLLAQVQVLTNTINTSCVLLIDDVAAELDEFHCQQVMNLLKTMNVQLFLTTIDKSSIQLDNWHDIKMFHVEQGDIKEEHRTSK